MPANVLALGAVADFGALNCQHTTKFDARQNVQLTTEPAFLQNRCYRFGVLSRLSFCSFFAALSFVGALG